ncbi:MAG: cytochrome c-type biosis protein CcmB [Actinomycetota bacterium]|jgi:heme exporter protein B
MSLFAVARLIAAKDLRIEWRSRIVLHQVVPFSGLVMVLFAFALDNDATLTRVAPGLVWLASMFSMLVVVQRSFAVEAADGALDALRVAGVRPDGIFLGKSLALAAQLAVLEVILLLAAVVLYKADVGAGSVPLLLATFVAATLGLAFVGTLYGGLASGASGRETLLPLLMLPVVAPVLIGATRATEAALGTNGASSNEGWPWVGLMVLFGVLFGAGGTLAFGSLVDE